MWKKGLDNLIITEHIKDKNESGKQRITDLTIFYKEIAEWTLGGLAKV